jgi:hypothetical protein
MATSVWPAWLRQQCSAGADRGSACLPKAGTAQRRSRPGSLTVSAGPQKYAVTSVGQRLEQWRLAIHLIEQRPFSGWGLAGYPAAKQQMVDQGLAHPSVMEYGHAHNEILDMWVKRGLPGLILLLAFYAVPAAIFWPTPRRLARADAAQRPRLLALRSRHPAAAGLLRLWLDPGVLRAQQRKHVLYLQPRRALGRYLQTGSPAPQHRLSPETCPASPGPELPEPLAQGKDTIQEANPNGQNRRHSERSQRCNGCGFTGAPAAHTHRQCRHQKHGGDDKGPYSQRQMQAQSHGATGQRTQQTAIAPVPRMLLAPTVAAESSGCLPPCAQAPAMHRQLEPVAAQALQQGPGSSNHSTMTASSAMKRAVFMCTQGASVKHRPPPPGHRSRTASTDR